MNESKVITLTAGYFPLTGTILIPLSIDDNAILAVTSNIIEINLIMSNSMMNRTPFGTYKDDKMEARIEDDVVEFGDRTFFGRSCLSRRCKIGGKEILNSVPIFVAQKITGTISEESVLRTALQKYHNSVGFCRPQSGSLLLHLINKSIIEHATVFYNMIHLKTLPSDQESNVTIKLGVIDNQSPLEKTLKLLPNTHFLTFVGNDRIEWLRFYQWSTIGAIVMVMGIQIQTPDGNLVTITDSPFLAMIDMGTSHCFFEENLCSKMRDYLRTFITAPETESCDILHDEIFSDFWKEGIKDAENVDHILKIPVEQCPNLIFHIQSNGLTPVALKMTRDNYVRKLPEYTITQSSKFMASDRKVHINEVELTIDSVSSMNTKIAILGNCLFIGAAVLIDWENNRIHVYK